MLEAEMRWPGCVGTRLLYPLPSWEPSFYYEVGCECPSSSSLETCVFHLPLHKDCSSGGATPKEVYSVQIRVCFHKLWNDELEWSGERWLEYFCTIGFKLSFHWTSEANGNRSVYTSRVRDE